MFYSQFGEDKYISQFFDDNYVGTCIDVGADDGISGSNTHYFEKKGWFSLCVEPIPESFNKCSSIRKNVINCCVGNYDKEEENFNIVTLHSGNTSAISSLKIDERLIESHRDLLNSIQTISVKVKTLNTIFKENNIPNNIDFISIDTENTEIDVLKGLDFNTYNIKFLIIENNFDEIMIENYLLDKNFKKIHRLAVNDFYVNKKYLDALIHNYFRIKEAYYYINDKSTVGNVTDITNILLQRYMYNYNNNIKVNNDLFTDTYIGECKNLFITIENIYTKENFKFNFLENHILDFNLIFTELNKYLLPINNLIEVSFGEIIDKYSILELKNKYIKDVNKLNEIKKEMTILEKRVSKITDTFFYRLLVHINEQIWLDTDIVKSLNYNLNLNNATLFIEVTNKIFENNQKRFRLKNYFNILENSNIKECKSYSDNCCFLIVNGIEEIYDKIPEINYLCISYDIVYFNIDYKDIIDKIFKNPNINFVNVNNDNILKINLYDYEIDNNLRDIFDFNTIKYKSCGKLGDYLNQLSVICEKYYETGQKGELYIADLENGDKFSYGLEYTYNDTYNSIISQKYIKNYQIYNNENIDINLSMWRNNIDFFQQNKYNWVNIYGSFYQIKWGKNKWLTSYNNTNWNDKIIINITNYRFMSINAINKLYEKICDDLDNCVFICNENDDYNNFCDKTKLKINCYNPKSFDETLMIINSCKIGFYGFSSLAVMANALHRPHYLLGFNNADFDLNNLKDDITHILDIFV